MCSFPTEDRLGWRSGCPFNTKAEKEILSFGSRRRGCTQRRKRLELKASQVDELFWPLLLLFYIDCTFHSKYCSHVGVGEGDIDFSVGNVEKKDPQEPFPPASGYLMFGVGRKNFRLYFTIYTPHLYGKREAWASKMGFKLLWQSLRTKNCTKTNSTNLVFANAPKENNLPLFFPLVLSRFRGGGGSGPRLQRLRPGLA